MTPISEYNKRASRLFNELIREHIASFEQDVSVIIVTHILPDRPALIEALRDNFHLIGVIPKTKSINFPTLAYIRDDLKVQLLMYSREDLEKESNLNSIISAVPSDNALIILDIGGYFAPYGNYIKEVMGHRFLGVVEDTENGHQKYLASQPSYSIISAARSPLKEPEDFLVGRSIVYSSEAVIRLNNDLLINKRVLVFGYGKIGKSIADALSVLNIAVSIYDVDPIKMAQARSHGYDVGDRLKLLRENDVIFAATGNKCIVDADLEKMKNGAFIISVTSADDEFGPLNESGGYHKYLTDGHITIFQSRKKAKRRVFMVNEGNAVNFLHNAVVGPYIYLIQSELILALFKLSSVGSGAGLFELSRIDRSKLAKSWLERFNQ